MRIYILLGLIALAFAKKSYEGYQVLSVTPRNEAQLKFLQSFLDDERIDFWHFAQRIDIPADIMLPPEMVDIMRHTLGLHGMTSVIISKNVQEDIDAEEERLKNPSPFYDYGDYNTYDVIVEELQALLARCPSGFECTLGSIGQSVQGRELWVLYVGSGNPAHWFDSAIHAREWLAPATLMNIIDRIFAQADDEAVKMLANNDYYFLPVMNPDGYEFTFTDDRMWRKNRGNNAGSACVGTDLNRNYDHNWSGPGASGNPCSDTYYGDSVASEPETEAVQDYARQIADHTLSWHSIHTYGYYWLWPYGDCSMPDRWQDVEQVADATCAAIEGTNGDSWACGNSCQVLYQTSGGTIDFTLDLGMLYSYVPELRGPGFTPPPSAIAPSFAEIWNGFVAMRDEVAGIEGLP